jgi:hypothetical protein
MTSLIPAGSGVILSLSPNRGVTPLNGIDWRIR